MGHAAFMCGACKQKFTSILSRQLCCREVITLLSTCDVPERFKSPTMAPLYKLGDQQAAMKYCPKSLLPIVSKIVEKVIVKQLKSFLSENSLLRSVQFAQRYHHSTEDALVYAVNNILLARDKGHSTGLVFVDLSKAFDCV